MVLERLSTFLRGTWKGIYFSKDSCFTLQSRIQIYFSFNRLIHASNALRHSLQVRSIRVVAATRSALSSSYFNHLFHNIRQVEEKKKFKFYMYLHHWSAVDTSFSMLIFPQTLIMIFQNFRFIFFEIKEPYDFI